LTLISHLVSILECPHAMFVINKLILDTAFSVSALKGFF